MHIAYLQREEVEQLLQSIDNTRDRLLVRFLYESGGSVSDVSALKTSAVHSDGSVHFPSRKAVISTELARELLAQASTHIFHTRQAPTITPKRIQQIIKPYLLRFQKGKATPHILRYSHIVYAYRQGIPLQTISAQTGLGMQRLAQIIADIPTTKQYNAFFMHKGGKT